MSKSLDFQVLDQKRMTWCHVEFESVSIHRNLLSSVTFDDLPLDTTELRHADAKLYNAIQNAMVNHAASYWESEKEVANA